MYLKLIQTIIITNESRQFKDVYTLITKSFLSKYRGQYYKIKFVVGTKLDNLYDNDQKINRYSLQIILYQMKFSFKKI